MIFLQGTIVDPRVRQANLMISYRLVPVGKLLSFTLVSANEGGLPSVADGGRIAVNRREDPG